MNNIMTFRAIKKMVFTIALLLPIHLGTGIVPSLNVVSNSEEGIVEKVEDPLPTKTRVVLLDLKGEYCDTSCFLAQRRDTVEFLAKTFAVNKDYVVNELVNINSKDKYIENNIGRILNENGELIDYGSFEKGLIEYLFKLRNINPSVFDEAWVPYQGDSEYVEDLIRYFTKIYDNVDYLTAISIGASESGYYKVTYMLNYNNIFGGMGSNGLIQYKNIEYGVLSFIRLLSYNYYGVGLDTVESIGQVYCPVFESGVKIASPHWVNLVYNAMNYYQDSYEELTASELIKG